MNELFFPSFWAIFQAILKVAIIAVVAGIMVRKKFVTQDQIDSLSAITVNVLLPCLIFSKTIAVFNPHGLSLWWLIPLTGVFMLFGGIAIGWLFFFKELPQKNNMLSLAGIQNAGYLVLPIGQMIYHDQFDLFAMYCFLFILGYNPVLWSVGKYLSTTNKKFSGNLKEFITPPLCASALSVLLVLTGTHKFVPAILNESIDFMGKATIPIATFILGATLGSISFRQWPPVIDTIRVLFIRFLIIPVIMIMILKMINLEHTYPVLAGMLVIQASAAPAVAIIIQVRKYGGDYQTIGSMMLISYLVCLFAIPFWLTLWKLI